MTSSWFCAEVIRRREALKLSARQLADRAGLHENTVYNIESGHDPRLTTAVKLALVLEINLSPPEYVQQEVMNGRSTSTS